MTATAMMGVTQRTSSWHGTPTPPDMPPWDADPAAQPDAISKPICQPQPEPINTHGFIMPNGRHKGELITRVPVGYLKWMVRENHGQANYAKAELERRGTVTPDIEISGHAIDRASLRCRKIWHQTRQEDEGLHAWLCRMSMGAIEQGEQRGDKIAYAGVLWAIERDGAWPSLKTVMRDAAREAGC